MRVLWLTNTPSLAEAYLNKKNSGGGWIKSLEEQIKKVNNISLGIVFYHDELIKPFIFGETNYFPLYFNSKNKFIKLYNRIFAKNENENDLKIILKYVREFNPDLIHILGTELPYGLIQENINNIPVVISIQGNVTVYEYKYFDGIKKESVRKHTTFIERLLFTNINNTYKAFKNRAKRERLILKMSKNIIGRTNWDRNITKVLAPKRNYFHNDEILRDSFYENIWDNKIENNVTIFSTSSGSLYKGIELILIASKFLNEMGVNFAWNVAGLIESDRIVQIAKKATKIQNIRNINFLGQLNEKQLVSSLLDSHIYIMTSHIENSPNSLCEAMILGMPCIATNVGGTSSMLEHKVEGILIPAGDPWMLAGTILEVRDNYENAKKMGYAARVKALARHNPEKNVKELISIYKKITSIL